MGEKSIGARPRPDCLLCGSPGRPAHTGLRDRLFGAPGEWGLHRCENRHCDLYWLNPMPEPGDLPVAYEAYYTHTDAGGGADAGAARGSGSWLRSAYGMLKDITGTTRARRLADESYLGGIRPGRVLEVGCGDGSRLLRLKAHGWAVEGQDVYPQAAAHGLAGSGITVHAGHLEVLRLPAERYDAIVMKHVIEHAVDPAALLGECRRLLAPEGQLVLVTPNTGSFGHLLFGRHWMHLDPPRHLFLFSVRNLAALVRKAGFSRADAWSSAVSAGYAGIVSWNIRTRGSPDLEESLAGISLLIGGAFQIAASLAIAVWRNSGEEVVLRAWK